MSVHEADPMPFLFNLELSPAVRLQNGVEAALHVLDMGESGATIGSISEASGIHDTKVGSLLAILTKGGYATVTRQPSYKQCVAMPKLHAVGNGYNSLLCEVLADELPESLQPDEVRRMAVARLALGYELEAPRYDEPAVLSAAAAEGMGSTTGILYRALTSLAVMGGKQHVVEHEVRNRVQEWGLRQ
ncbi:MAG TPA: hypothetical protein VD735_03570 [Candidatus Saccharimonadales bacterium]|nr:hypothetical protein [Candidatus Saccharimonadales bacterium]